MRKLALLVLACWLGTATAQIYTWKDDNGITHYSDQPPAGKTHSVKALPVPPAPPPSPKETETRTRASEDARARERSHEKERLAAQQQTNCEKAKADLQAFENSPRRTAAKVITGKDGKKVTVFNAVDGADRANEDAALRKAIDEACR